MSLGAFLVIAGIVVALLLNSGVGIVMIVIGVVLLFVPVRG